LVDSGSHYCVDLVDSVAARGDNLVVNEKGLNKRWVAGIEETIVGAHRAAARAGTAVKYAEEIRDMLHQCIIERERHAKMQVTILDWNQLCTVGA
jgi:hypothetical protein